MNQLPTPPAGTYWEIMGEPQGDWVWSTETVWLHDEHGHPIHCEVWATAQAPGATAYWRTG